MVYHPHDKPFKETFGDLNVTANFIHHYLPGEMLDIIDTDTLAPLKESFIQPELRGSYSDLLFRAEVGDEQGYLYFLFEHKSYPTADIAFQLLGYMLQIWSQHIKKERATTLPIIISIIFYHGERKWEEAKRISDWIAGYAHFPPHIQRFVPDYDFMYYDFSPEGDKEITGNPKLRAYLTLSRVIFTRDLASLIETILTVERLLSTNNLSYFDTIMIYLLNAREDLPVEMLKEKLTIEGRRRLMSIAEQLREEGLKEGEEKGLKKGLRKGEIKKSREIAKKLLLLDMDKEQIIDATDLTLEEIEQIEKDIE